MSTGKKRTFRANKCISPHGKQELLTPHTHTQNDFFNEKEIILMTVTDSPCYGSNILEEKNKKHVKAA